MEALIKTAAATLSGADRVVALTGAGISIDSGIPPFRGKGGLWEKFDPMAVGHIDAFLRDPEVVWNSLFLELGRVLKTAQPNTAHKRLAELERRGRLETIITQNIDGLHQEAGCADVIEFHGTFARQRCMVCNGHTASSALDLSQLPPRCDCGGVYRPDCVLFGELIPETELRRAREAAARCDVLLVVGTSATVEPAATIPFIARDTGARVIEINTEPTPLTGRISHTFLQGKAGDVLSSIVNALDRNG